jgi:hypothetical protein
LITIVSARIVIKLDIQDTEESMFPDQMEFVARERRQAFLEAAEQYRLRKIVAAQQTTGDTTTWHLRCWLGAQLVEWGFKLQGYRVASLPQLPEREPCNG